MKTISKTSGKFVQGAKFGAHFLGDYVYGHFIHLVRDLALLVVEWFGGFARDLEVMGSIPAT